MNMAVFMNGHGLCCVRLFLTVSMVFKSGMLFGLGRSNVTQLKMDSKTLTTVLLVFVCVLFFPVLIAVVGGMFGVMGSILGGLFGVIGGIFGAIFGAIGAIVGAVFGVFGWMVGGGGFHWPGPFHFFNGDLFAILIIVLIIALISRSKRSGLRRP